MVRYQPRAVPDLLSHLEFAISSDADPVRIFSDTWGRDGPRPWAVEYGGRRMVIDSAAPWQAYQLILPYLDEFTNMTRDGLDEMIRPPVPTASLSSVAR